MLIGDRLRSLRESKKLSQGDIEDRSGLLRCYISRVENGHTVPSVETLERLARAMGVPMYRIFFEGVAPARIHNSRVLQSRSSDDLSTDSKLFRRFSKFLKKTDERHQRLLLTVARKMVETKVSRKPRADS